MSKVTKRTKRIAITTSIMLAVGGGAAIAYWSATGHGAVDTAAAGTSTAFIIKARAGQAEGLTPGGPAKTVEFTVSHTGTGTQRLASLVAIVATTNGDAWTGGPNGGCSAEDFEVTAATFDGSPTKPPFDIATGVTKTGTVTVSMKNDPNRNQNDCKGLSVPLYFNAQLTAAAASAQAGTLHARA